MKETNKLLAIYLMIIGIFVIYSCNKELEEPVRINFGILPMSTNIKSFTQNGNIVVVDFETTIGAKYSTLIIPFGKEEPVRKEGFTATEEITRKVFD